MTGLHMIVYARSVESVTHDRTTHDRVCPKCGVGDA